MRIYGAGRASGLGGLIAVLALLPACRTGAGAPDAPAPLPPPAPAPASTEPAPATPAARSARWIDLEVGDCLAALPSTDLDVVSQTVTVVDCAAAHQAEVFLLAPVDVDAAITTVADRACADGFADYTGRAVTGSPFGVTYLIDSRQDRTANNPDPSTVICLLQATNGQPLTRSARR